MDDDTTESDRRGIERDELDARIKELKRQRQHLEDRIDRLRYRRSQLASDAPGETPEKDTQNIILGHLDRLEDQTEDDEEVRIPDLLDEVETEGVPREVARESLDSLKRKGEVYEPGAGDAVRKV